MSQFAHTMGPAQPQLPALPSARDTTPATGEENWISLADLLRTIQHALAWRSAAWSAASPAAWPQPACSS